MGGGTLPFTGSLRGPGIAPLLHQAPLPISPASPHFFPLGHPFCPAPREGMWQTLALPLPCALNSPADVLCQQPPPPPPETSERSGRLEVGQRGCCYPEHVRRLCKLCSRPPACWESAFTSRQGVRFKTPPSFYLARERSVPWLRVLLFGWGSWTRG